MYIPSPTLSRDVTLCTQNVPNWDRYTIVGTKQEIFKDYLRLTSVSIAIWRVSYLEATSFFPLGTETRTDTAL